MTLKELLAGIGGSVLALMTLIQMSPLQINPWSALIRALGRAMNQDLLDKVDHLSEEVVQMKDQWGQDKAEGYRTHILRFGDEIMHGVPHSKEHFDQILKDIARYDAYCESHPLFENNVTGLTSQRIKEIYKERLEKGDFL